MFCVCVASSPPLLKKNKQCIKKSKCGVKKKKPWRTLKDSKPEKGGWDQLICPSFVWFIKPFVLERMGSVGKRFLIYNVFTFAN